MTTNNDIKVEKKPQGFYQVLLQRCASLQEKWDLPETITEDIRVLTIEIAREQFTAGNRSGIAWIKNKYAEAGITNPDA